MLHSHVNINMMGRGLRLDKDNKDLFVPKNKMFTFFELYEKKYLRRVPATCNNHNG